MGESSSHKQAKARAAGPNGQTEVPLSRGRRLDALSASGHKATEVERSGDLSALRKEAGRLEASGAKQKVLAVPQPDMSKAVEAMKSKNVRGTVSNIGGTQKKRV